MNTYHRNTAVRLQASILNSAGALTSPAACTVKILKPDGTLVSTTPSSGGTGIQYYDVTLDQEGTWHYMFEATSPTVAKHARMYVANSPFYSS